MSSEVGDLAGSVDKLSTANSLEYGKIWKVGDIGKAVGHGRINDMP